MECCDVDAFIRQLDLNCMSLTISKRRLNGASFNPCNKIQNLWSSESHVATSAREALRIMTFLTSGCVPDADILQLVYQILLYTSYTDIGTDPWTNS